MELSKAVEILKQWYEDDEAADREYYLRSHDMYCTVRDAEDRIAELEAVVDVLADEVELQNTCYTESEGRTPQQWIEWATVKASEVERWRYS